MNAPSIGWGAACGLLAALFVSLAMLFVFGGAW